jgi:hypothetical protein
MSCPTIPSVAWPAERWIALVGPEVTENLSLRYLAASLERSGYCTQILSFNGERDFSRIVATILNGHNVPFLTGLSLAFQYRAKDFLALAMALREQGYRGHLTAGGHLATFEPRHSGPSRPCMAPPATRGTSTSPMAPRTTSAQREPSGCAAYVEDGADGLSFDAGCSPRSASTGECAPAPPAVGSSAVFESHRRLHGCQQLQRLDGADDPERG